MLKIILLLIISQICFAQQKLLVNNTGDVIYLNGNNPSEVIQKLQSQSGQNAKAGCLNSGYRFGFFPSHFIPDTIIKLHHKDVIGSWFVAPANGEIDTIFWYGGDSTGAKDTLVLMRVVTSMVGTDYGPGVSPYPSPPVSWGYWYSTNDKDQGVAAFIEDATDTNWISTIAPPPLGGPPTRPPWGDEIWGFGGFPKIHRQGLNYVAPRAETNIPLEVTVGQRFVISFKVNSGPDHIVNDVATEFTASHYGVPSPPCAWVFYEHDSVLSPSSKRGWHAIGGVNINIWYSMTIHGALPPRILTFDHLGDTYSPGPRTITAEIEECNNVIMSSDILYSYDGGEFQSSPLNLISGNTWSGTIPNNGGMSVRYYLRVIDYNDIVTKSELVQYNNLFITAQVKGNIFNDINKNGIRDQFESPVQGGIIRATGPLSDSAISNSYGNYTLNLSEGDFTITQDSMPGWVRTMPSDYYSLHIDSGQIISGKDFGNHNKWEFISDIVINDNGGIRDTLRFGIIKGATDSIDLTLGEKELPYIPPAGSFDIRWKITGTYGSKIDIRDALQSGSFNRIYTGRIQPGNGGYPFQLNWEPQILLTGSIILRDWLTHGGQFNINMKAESSLTISNSNINTFEIVYSFNPGRISGVNFLDDNANSIKEAGEGGLPGWQIALSGTLSDSTITDSSGYFEFQTGPGSYSVQRINQKGWLQTTPNPSSIFITEGLNVSNINFGSFQLASISGQVFSDGNYNEFKDSDDSLLSGWTVSLSGTKSYSVITDDSGRYIFKNIPKGNYNVSAMNKMGWCQIIPVGTGSYNVNVDRSSITLQNKDFGMFYAKPFEFTYYIIIADNGALFDTLKFGTKFGATDGFDPDFNEIELGFKPPHGTFDVRWNISGTNGTKLDLRQILYSNHIRNIFVGEIQPGPGGYPFVIRWDKNLFANGYWILQDNSTHGLLFSINMNEVDFAVIDNPAITTFEIVNLALVTRAYTFNSRWNMISNPLKVSNNRKSNLFPTAISDAYSFNQMYVISDSLYNGIGYWLKFGSQQSINITGFARAEDTVTVKEGWNMIGSISTPMDVRQIISIPPGIVTSNFFGYNGMYEITDKINPGKGYWVKVNQDGELILSINNVSSLANRIKIIPTLESPPSPPRENGELNAIPKEYTLEHNYPNPFNPVTTLKYGLPLTSNVKLKIYNTLGQLVAVLVDEIQEAGYQSVNWNESNKTSGVYFYRLDATSVSDPSNMFTQVRKMIVVK
ncbi:MAG: SdrD B-like domain-containing protein [Bacteroidota bacterium]|nr:SdrD B-like domain-containing protein [Bacteroidota bacterium]